MRLSYFLLGLASLLGLYLLFGHRLAARDLWSSHEARAAMNAQTILDTGDWDLPRLYDGTPELQKPPLYYYLVAGLAWLRGGTVDAACVRLPATLAALACLGLLILFGWRRQRLLAGVLSALILATALHFTWLARIGRIDMPLTLTISTAITAFYLAQRGPAGKKRFGFLLLGYVSLASGILLKGPIGLVLPVAVLVADGIVEKRASGGRQPPVSSGQQGADAHRSPGLGLWWGLPLVAGLTLPWFFWVNARTQGELFRVFIWYHNIERGLGGSRLRGHPWWFYGPQWALDFLPWSPLLVLAAWWAWRKRWFRQDAEMRLGLVWLLAVMVVLSCARFKRADYLLPAFPGAALFLGCVLARWQTSRGRKPGLAFPCCCGIAALCTLGWLLYVERVLPAAEAERESTRFAAQIRRRAPKPEEVLFFRTESHALAFHVGRPLSIVLEYHHLSDRLLRPGIHYVVMPPEWVEECRQVLSYLHFEEVLRNTTLAAGQHERPLVLLRSGTTPGR